MIDERRATQRKKQKRGPIRACVARRRPLDAGALRRLNFAMLTDDVHTRVRMNDLQKLLGAYERLVRKDQPIAPLERLITQWRERADAESETSRRFGGNVEQYYSNGQSWAYRRCAEELADALAQERPQAGECCCRAHHSDFGFPYACAQCPIHGKAVEGRPQDEPKEDA